MVVSCGSFMSGQLFRLLSRLLLKATMGRYRPDFSSFYYRKTYVLSTNQKQNDRVVHLKTQETRSRQTRYI